MSSHDLWAAGKMTDQELWDRANEVAEWAGVTAFPDPTGERYVFLAGSRDDEPCEGLHHYTCLGKKSECPDEMEEWFDALEALWDAAEEE